MVKNKTQIYYSALPVPSNSEDLPKYINNEFQILQNVVSDINDSIINSTSGTIDLTNINNSIDTLNTEYLSLNSNVTTLNNTTSDTTLKLTALSTNVNSLQESVYMNIAGIAKTNADIDAMSSDNIISKSEKSTLYINWKKAFDEFSDIMRSADLYGVQTLPYSNAYNVLSQYLTSYPIEIDKIPATGEVWCSQSNNIYIDGAIFRSIWNTYHIERQLLLNKINQNTKNLINDLNTANDSIQTDVTSILDTIYSITSDNGITQSEKSTVFVDWKRIYDEKPGIVTQATNASVSSTAYVTAYTNLATYLTTAPISIDATPTDGATWCADPNTITIVGVDFRNYFTTYYNEKQNLLNVISTALKTVADTANTNATAASTAASTASTNATTAINGINDILNDGKITQDEKPQIFMDWKAIYDEKPDIVTKATSYSVSTTNYTTAYTTLANYLTASPISIDAAPTTGATWCANSTAITITATTFRSNFTSYYSERQLVLNAISAAAKVLADNAQSTANTANATANTANTNASNAVTTANSAATTASGAATAAADRLSKSVNNILSGSAAIIAGTLVINSLGNRTSGSGVAITSNGLAGFNSAGSSTFAIDTSGNATFAGALSAATGSFAGSLSAVTGSFGAVAVSSTGSISAGKTSQASTTSGFWLGGDGQFNFGNSTANLIYNGTDLVLTGKLNVGGTNYATSDFLNSNTTATQVGLGNVSNLTPANQTSTGLNAGTTITGGGITMSSGGVIKGGKTTFTDTTSGYFLGYTGSNYGFHFGNSSKSIKWDGSALTVTGDIIANGNIMTDAVDTYKVSAGSITNQWYASYDNITAPATYPRALPTVNTTYTDTFSSFILPGFTGSAILEIQIQSIVHNRSTSTNYAVELYTRVIRNGSTIIDTEPQTSWGYAFSGVQGTNFTVHTGSNNGSMIKSQCIQQISVSSQDTIQVVATHRVGATQTTVYLDCIRYSAVLYKR